MTKRKYFNNYLYITDQSIDEFNNFGKVRLKMKYGRGTSHKEYRNSRTEQRLNCNAPSSGFETVYNCKNHKDYIDREIYTLKCLKKKYIFTKDTQTGNNHEFFYSLEEVHSLKEIYSIWHEVQLDVITIHNEFNKIEEIIEEDGRIEEEFEKLQFEEELSEEEEEKGNTIIDYTEYNSQTMSLKWAKIDKCEFNEIKCFTLTDLLSQIVKYCYDKDVDLNINKSRMLIGGDYAKKIRKQKKESNQRWNYKEIIPDKLYLLNSSSGTNFKKIIELQKMVKFPLELKISLKE